MVKGLGTVIYPVADLSRAKAWYSIAFQQQPGLRPAVLRGFQHQRIRTRPASGSGRSGGQAEAWPTGGKPPTSIALSNISSRQARR